MPENLISRLLPHQGCVITPREGAIEVTSKGMNWVMAAVVAPFACRAPFVFRVVGSTIAVREFSVARRLAGVLEGLQWLGHTASGPQ